MMVEKRVQEALKGLQVKPEGAIEPTSEGAEEGSVDDDTHMLNMVMHVRTRALRSSVRQNKRLDKSEEVKSLVQDAIRRQTVNQGALTVSAYPKATVTQKVTKSQVMRIPTYDQHMAKRQEQADT